MSPAPRAESRPMNANDKAGPILIATGSIPHRRLLER